MRAKAAPLQAPGVRINTRLCRLGGREQAAEIESARAHDLRGRGVSSDAYIESLAKQKPGPELLGSENGLDPLPQAQAVAVKIVQTGMAQGW